jgi:hypothetical protein
MLNRPFSYTPSPTSMCLPVPWYREHVRPFLFHTSMLRVLSLSLLGLGLSNPISEVNPALRCNPTQCQSPDCDMCQIIDPSCQCRALVFRVLDWSPSDRSRKLRDPSDLAQKWWKTDTCSWRGELASTSSSTSIPTHASTVRRIYTLFANHVDDSTNVHGETQRVVQDFQSSYW